MYLGSVSPIGTDSEDASENPPSNWAWHKFNWFQQHILVNNKYLKDRTVCYQSILLCLDNLALACSCGVGEGEGHITKPLLLDLR